MNDLYAILIGQNLHRVIFHSVYNGFSTKEWEAETTFISENLI